MHLSVITVARNNGRIDNRSTFFEYPVVQKKFQVLFWVGGGRGGAFVSRLLIWNLARSKIGYTKYTNYFINKLDFFFCVRADECFINILRHFYEDYKLCNIQIACFIRFDMAYVEKKIPSCIFISRVSSCLHRYPHPLAAYGNAWW